MRRLRGFGFVLFLLVAGPSTARAASIADLDWLGEGVLRASIEGLSKGQLKTIEFPMKKVDCETQR